MSREPLEFVEIDIPRCVRVYGTAPCAAVLGTTGKRKCYNTKSTCQDRANYSETTPLTLRFAREGLPMPKGTFAFPCLSDVVQSSTSVNIAGSDDRYGQLGQQSALNFRLKDFTFHDRGIDPYREQRVAGTAQTDEGGYLPEDRGTFLAKLKTRWTNYAGADVRLIRGYLVNGVLTEVTTYYHKMTEMAGPSDGVLQCKALGILDLANEKTALCPKPSPGRLNADITNSQTTFSVTPSGTGASYAASGWVCIGSEVMSFTRSGDNFTLGRAQRGSKAATHTAGDTVQQTYSVRAARVDDVALDLIQNFTTVPVGTWVTFTDWQAEVTRWGAWLQLTADICTPTPVATLLAEFNDLGCIIFADERAQKIRLRMNRPVDGETIRVITDQTIKEIRQEDRDGDRLTQVLFFSKQEDPTKSLQDDDNYNRKDLTVSSDATALYNKVASRKVYTRWLNQGDFLTVTISSQRLLRRFEMAPMRVPMTLDASQKAVALMDVIELSSDIMPDETGKPQKRLMQVIKRAENKAYHTVDIEVQRFDYNARYGFITANSYPVYSLATDAQKQRGAFISGATLKFADGALAYRII